MFKHIIEALKHFYYEELYDIPKYYVKIDSEIGCHIFTIAFIIFIILIIWVLIKNLNDVLKLKEDNRILRRKIEKHLYSVLKDKNTNK